MSPPFAARPADSPRFTRYFRPEQVVTVSGKGFGAGVGGRAGVPQARRSRLSCRVRIHRGRNGERRLLLEAGYAELVTAAHNQLAAPVILTWDNRSAHISAAVRERTGARQDRLTAGRLPACAPSPTPSRAPGRA